MNTGQEGSREGMDGTRAECLLPAKEYLQQLHRADVMIRHKLSEKEDLRNSLASITSCDASRERITTGSAASGSSGYAEKIVRLVAIGEEIDDRIFKLANLKHEIIDQIHNLKDADQIKILYKRYVGLEKFEQIAQEMGFSISNTFAVHKKALRELQKIRQKNKLCSFL